MKQIVKYILISVIAFAATINLSAQNKVSVKGKVVDAAGEPLPGVVVMLQGSNSATMTDDKGQYFLEFKVVDGKKPRINVSSMGYEEQTEDVNGRSVINFTLAEDNELLDESVVVGYGSMRRSDLTGSVTSVKLSDEAVSQNVTFDKLLQGRAAGVQVVSNSAAPDAAVSVLIRGASSFNSSSEPLYVVDGIIISTESNADLFTQGQDNTGSNEASNGLMGINPQDIASIEILKDASATAIYGSQGANGVVLITTKSANREKPVINANIGISVSTRYKKLEMLDFDEYVQYLDARRDTPGGGAVNTYMRMIYEDPDTRTGLQVKAMDWQDYVERTAISQNYYVSIAGNPNNTSYMASFAYNDGQGIIKNTGYDNYVIRLNMERKVTPKLKLATKINFSYLDSQLTQGASTGRLTAATSLTRSMFSTRPYKSLKEEFIDMDDQFDGASAFISGPDRWLTDFVNNRTEIRVTPNFTLEYKITKHLTLRSTSGMDYRSSEQYKWKSSRINSTTEGSIGAVATTRYLYWNTNNTLTYFRKLGNHRINAMAGVTFSSNGNSVETIEGWNIKQYKAQIDAINSAPNTAFRYAETESHLASAVARLVYNYKDRYVLTSTYRLDGSSKFRGSNKWASFPSFAFAWRANEEEWFRVPVISMLKVRLGWGRVGNQAISSYQTMSTYQFCTWPSHVQGNDAHYTPGMFPNNIANPNLKWETTEQTNLGLDFAMWRGRLTLTVDAYYKNTKDLLQNKTISTSSGYQNMWMNIGNISNRGIEITLDSTPLKIGDFEWQLGGNISFNKNRIEKISTSANEGAELFLSPTKYEYRNFFYGDDIGYGTYCKYPLNVFIEGQPMALFYGFKTAGIVQEGEEGIPVSDGGKTRGPGYIQYVDLDGNGYMNDNDRTIIGDPNPDFTYGINTSFRYKGLMLSVNLVGSYGNDIFNVNDVMDHDVSNVGINIRKEAFYNAWTSENMSQKYPGLGLQEGFDLAVISDRNVQDGSYLRLSNVSLSYDIPMKKGWFIKGLNLGVSGSNLWIWTKYSGFDPDVNSYGSIKRKGADMGAYPSARTFAFNAKFTF